MPADFDTVQEREEWIKEKTDPYLDEQHPTKKHNNWKLVEYWIVWDEGQHRESSSAVEETMSRTANDHNAGLAAIGATGNVEKKGPTGAEKHKLQVEKVMKQSNKLMRQMSLCESKLPSWRRTLGSDQFQKIRNGLSKCRDTREIAMDNLEDLKAYPAEEVAQTTCTDMLATLQSDLHDCSEALSEAMTLAQLADQDVKAEHLSQAGEAMPEPEQGGE